jgi:hypothetical protein
VGVPVLALGIPTVVECATLIHDTLLHSGISAPDARTAAKGAVGRGMFVSTTDIDLLLPRAALLLTDAIERAFSVPTAFPEAAGFCEP